MNAILILSILAGSALVAAAFLLCALPMLGILQQEQYSGRRFLRWLFRKNNMLLRRLGLLALCQALLIALFNFCFSFLGATFANLISALPFVGMLAVYLYANKKYALKVSLVYTSRAKRLIVCFAALLLGICFGVGAGLAAAAQAIGNDIVTLLRFLPFAAFPYLLPIVLALANFIMKGYELPHNARYIRQAKALLRESQCVKVGITGSCGKTSVKHVAARMLSQKYKVIATPASYNTPIGIARTVREQGLDCEVFLAEMGARRVGDIAELCEMVAPQIGVVTTINSQHLLTFGSLQNIAQEKGTLVQKSERSVVGMGASSLANEGSMVEGKQFSAEDITYTAKGSAFTLNLPDGRIRVETALLGKHAVQDISLAAALCSMLGMSKEEISSAVQKVTPLAHRLQLIESNGKYILDDSYNSNVDGAKNAVEALKLFEGKKYVVTPGLVELGAIEEAENANLGASLVGLDGVILVGETLVLAVRAGYLAAGGDEEKLRVVPTLARASEILAEELNAGDCVLFLNDLPDCYL